VAEEVGDEVELVVGVVGAELVDGGVHAGVEAVELGVAVAAGVDGDGAAVAGVALAGDPAAAFEAVEDAGDGGGVEAGAAGQGAGGQGAVAVDELEAVQVSGLEVGVGADVVVEQGQLGAELAQLFLDGGGAAAVVALGVGVPCWR